MTPCEDLKKRAVEAARIEDVKREQESLERASCGKKEIKNTIK